MRLVANCYTLFNLGYLQTACNLQTNNADLSNIAFNVFACEYSNTVLFFSTHSKLQMKNTTMSHDYIKLTIRYDTRCYFNVRSKADISRLNLPHGNDN